MHNDSGELGAAEIRRAVTDPAIVEIAWEMDAKGFANPGAEIVDWFTERTRERLESHGLGEASAGLVFLTILSDAAKESKARVEALRAAEG